jgi:hypothetical protein
MLDEKARCNFANRGLNALRQALHREQQLMLLRFDPVVFSSGFAEMNELPDLPAKLGEIAVLV